MCFVAKVEIKVFNVMIDGQNVLNQPVKNDMRTFNNIRKIRISQGYD